MRNESYFLNDLGEIDGECELLLGGLVATAEKRQALVESLVVSSLLSMLTGAG